MGKPAQPPVHIFGQLAVLLLLSEALVMSAIVVYDVIPENPWLKAFVDISGVIVIVVPVFCFWVYRKFGTTAPQLKNIAVKSATIIFSTEGGLMLALELHHFDFHDWQGLLFNVAGFTILSTPAFYYWVLKPLNEKIYDQRMPASVSTILASLVAFVIFVLDLSLPLGVAGAVPYVALVLVGLWFPHRNAAIGLAVVGSILTFFGYILSPPGGIFWIVLTNRALAIFAIWVTALLITKFKDDHAELEKSEANLANAQRIAHLGNWVWNIKTGSLWWSDEIYRLFGREKESYEATYENFLAAVPHDDRKKLEEAVNDALQGGDYAIEHALVLPDGSIRYVSEQGEVTFDQTGSPTHMFGTVYDTTERKKAENKLQHMADHDNLTGLPTRSLSIDRLSNAMAAARRNKSKVAVLFIDLDGFKAINDTLGHEAGDHVLMETAVRMNSCVREVDTVARIGGDEFMIVLVGIESNAGASTVAKKVIQAVDEPYKLETVEANIGASVGIALYPDHGENPEALLKKADQAMYEIKRSGKNNYAFAECSDSNG